MCPELYCTHNLWLRLMKIILNCIRIWHSFKMLMDFNADSFPRISQNANSANFLDLKCTSWLVAEVDLWPKIYSTGLTKSWFLNDVLDKHYCVSWLHIYLIYTVFYGVEDAVFPKMSRKCIIFFYLANQNWGGGCPWHQSILFTAKYVT